MIKPHNINYLSKQKTTINLRIHIITHNNCYPCLFQIKKI